MIRWICSVKPSDVISMVNLHGKLGLCDIDVAIRVCRLRWYGHVQGHEEKEMHRVRSITVPGVFMKGLPKKTWEEIVTQEVKVYWIKSSDALDKGSWN